MLQSPMNQAVNSFSPPRIAPSNMIEGDIRMILLLKKLADLFRGKILKSRTEPQVLNCSLVQQFNKEAIIDRALCKEMS